MQPTKPPVNKDLILREKLAIERTVMANDRTLLSFIRTSLYFFVAGLTFDQLLTIKNEVLVEMLCFSVGAVLFLTGWHKYLSNHKKIKESRRHVGLYLGEVDEED